MNIDKPGTNEQHSDEPYFLLRIGLSSFQMHLRGRLAGWLALLILAFGAFVGYIVMLVFVVLAGAFSSELTSDKAILSLSILFASAYVCYAGLFVVQSGIWRGIDRNLERSRHGMQRGKETAKAIREFIQQSKASR